MGRTSAAYGEVKRRKKEKFFRSKAFTSRSHNHQGRWSEEKGKRV